MPDKRKSDLMARLRKERAGNGLVELRLWITPEQKERVKKYVARLKRAEAKKALDEITEMARFVA